MNPLGVVYTPLPWARWALTRLDAPARVAAGASFCDPTAGKGVFAQALAQEWAQGSGTFDPAWARRITLIERDGSALEDFARDWRERWGFGFPESHLVETDVVTAPPDQRFDLLAGNPPWVTFPDLEPEDQDRYRPWFRALNLVGSPSELLLGRSRLDLAALVTARAFSSLGAPGARAGFFLPLSLFHSEGAPQHWRRWRPEVVYDLSSARPFPGVATRCGWAEFALDTAQEGPTDIPYHAGTPGTWSTQRAHLASDEASWRILGEGVSADLPRCALEVWQRPRQGLNTGGLNAAFQVTQPPPGVDPAFVHPLVPRTERDEPDRWVIVPYDRTGRILAAPDLEASGLGRYWAPWHERLAARRGILLGSQLTKGRWWALLGINAYAFAPYKVVWSAYGKDKMDARVWGPRNDGAIWQADQALQAYVPCQTDEDAQRVARFLNSREVGDYLTSLRGAGTRNWAQPGRFKALWQFPPEPGRPEGTTGS